MDLWGPIDIRTWRSVPHIAGRCAAEADVKAGRAVFYCKPVETATPEPVSLPLPACALQRIEGTVDPVPVIVIQLERVRDDVVMAGVRYLGGGNGICMFNELIVLDEPDDRFRGSARE